MTFVIQFDENTINTIVWVIVTTILVSAIITLFRKFMKSPHLRVIYEKSELIESPALSNIQFNFINDESVKAEDVKIKQLGDNSPFTFEDVIQQGDDNNLDIDKKQTKGYLIKCDTSSLKNATLSQPFYVGLMTIYKTKFFHKKSGIIVKIWIDNGKWYNDHNNTCTDEIFLYGNKGKFVFRLISIITKRNILLVIATLISYSVVGWIFF